MRAKLPQNEDHIKNIRNKNLSQRSVKIEMEEEVPAVIREMAVSTFQTELPEDEQERRITSFIELEYPHGYLPPQSVIKNLAAMKWFETKSNEERNHAVA